MGKEVNKKNNLLSEAIVELNKLQEEAMKHAKDKLADSMPDALEKFLKEEYDKKMVDESIIDDDPESITSEKGEDETMANKGGEEHEMVSETEDVEDKEDTEEVENIEEEGEVEADIDLDSDLTEDAIDQAIKDIEFGDDETDSEEMEEHDLKLDFDDEGIDVDLPDFDKKFELEFEDGEVTEPEIESAEDEIDTEESEGEEFTDDVEKDDEIDLDVDLDALDDEMDDEDVDESLSHVITHSNAKQTGSENNTNYGKEKRLRLGVQESLNKEKSKNKKLTTINEQLKTTNQEFKGTFAKLKDQLYEMAVFNANLSHVNNLFVEHSTTVDEKKEIIREFKNINTIEESKNIYNKFLKTLNEGKSNKKTIDTHINKSNGESASKKLHETVSNEQENINEGVLKIKRMMKLIDNRK